MALTLSTPGEATWRTHAQPIGGGRAGSFLDKGGLAASLTAVTLLNTVLTPGEGAVRAGAAFPYAGLCAVGGHVGARRTLVAHQLVTSDGVDVAVVSRRQRLLCGWAGGQCVG